MSLLGTFFCLFVSHPPKHILAGAMVFSSNCKFLKCFLDVVNKAEETTQNYDNNIIRIFYSEVWVCFGGLLKP